MFNTFVTIRTNERPNKIVLFPSLKSQPKEKCLFFLINAYFYFYDRGKLRHPCSVMDNGMEWKHHSRNRNEIGSVECCYGTAEQDYLERARTAEKEVSESQATMVPID